MFLTYKSQQYQNGPQAYLVPNESSLKDKERPYPKVPAIGGPDIPVPKKYDKQKLMDWIKKTPEALGIARRIVQDIVTHVDFEYIGTNQKFKKPAEDRAYRFTKRNFFKSQLKSGVFDWVIIGDLYEWIGKVDGTVLKEKVKALYLKHNLEFKEEDFRMSDYLDEDMSGINAIQYVPGTTMDIFIDKNRRKVIGYNQRGQYKQPNNWSPEEIIHGKFMELDGDIYGFTPTKACEPIIQTLGLIKDYAGNFFAGGGVPDFIFMLEDSMPGNPTFELLKLQIEKYGKTPTNRGNLVLGGGKISLERINQFNKDMEFRQLAIYYTGILAVAFNMTSDMLKPILGTDVKGSAGGSDVDDTGYWRNIAEAQEYLEELFNSQLFNPHFSVNLKLKRNHLQEQIRQAQKMATMFPVVKELYDKDAVNLDFVYMSLGIPKEYQTGEMKNSIDMMQEQQKLQTPFMSNQAALDGQARQSYRNQKKQQAKPQSDDKSRNVGA